MTGRPSKTPDVVILALSLLGSMSIFAGPAITPDGGESDGPVTGPDSRWFSQFLDPDDGWLDLSTMFDNPGGFIPLVIPITEEAVGAGLAVAPVFVTPNDPAKDGSPVRPNVAALGGFRTRNGSKGVLGTHNGYWFDGQLQTTFSGLGTSVNLDFNGLNGESLQYNLESTAFLAKANFRLGESDFFAGFGFIYADMVTDFEDALPVTLDGDGFFSSNTTLAGPKVSFLYDSRDNIFTPSKGVFAEIGATFYDPAFGASSSHQRYDLAAIHYWQLRKNLFLGWRGDLNISNGETPFYALPYIKLRGVPALQYQGKIAASTEAELRWQFWERFSLIAFGGAGLTDTKLDVIENSESVFTVGSGFRYEIARRYNLHVGVDYGVSNKGDSGFYLTFGSAWGRP